MRREREREPINYRRIIQLQFDYVHLHQLTTSYDKPNGKQRHGNRSIDRSLLLTSRLVYYVAVHQTKRDHTTPHHYRNHIRNHVVDVVRAKIGEEKCRGGGGGEGQVSKNVVEDLGPYGGRSKR